jgi:hypothetical protein
MSFAKYCALLRTGALYFPATSSFDDPWEGSHDMWYAAGVDLISFFMKVKCQRDSGPINVAEIL